jgi:UDP-N-acetylmuramoyl-tripeptide--D-alanyl-D-alanine ligase
VMRALHLALPVGRRGQWFENSAVMAERVHALLDAGDVAMVKGSLGSDMARVVSAIKNLERFAGRRAEQ